MSILFKIFSEKDNKYQLFYEQMRDLMKRILSDWNELNNLQEIKIIKEYADIGRFITLIVICKQYFEIIYFIY